MSKAKVVSEYLKMIEAGMEPRLLATDEVMKSTPDKNSVGQFVTNDGSCRIARTSRVALKTVSRPAGWALRASNTP